MIRISPLPSSVLRLRGAMLVCLLAIPPAQADDAVSGVGQGTPHEPTVPVEPSVPVEPTVPVEPGVPVDQTGPVQPSIPALQPGPVEPVIPAEQPEPVETGIPAEQPGPVEPAIPAGQSMPVEQSPPVEPANDGQPASDSAPEDVEIEAPVQDAVETSESGPAEKPSRELSADLVYAVLVGEIARQRDNPRMAMTHYLHAARLSSDPAMAELAARAALAVEDPEAVRRALAVWLELAPESLSAHQISAYTLLENGDIEGATEHLRHVIALSDADKDGFMLVAGLVGKLSSEQRRLDLMQVLVAEQPENADAHHALAMVAAAVERYDMAIEAARRAAELRPDWDGPRVFIVRLLLAQDRREEARETLERFVDVDPENHGLRMLYAQLLVEEKEFSRARNLFERMLDNKPKEPDVLFALGILSLQLDDVDAARDYFNRLYSTGKRSNDAAFYLGQVEEIAENHDAALEWYAKVRGENRADAQIHTARIRAVQGNVASAREVLQQLRDGSSEDVVTLYLIEAEILDDVDHDQEAMEVYDIALEALPGNADLLYARAMHAVGLNRIDILERDLHAILAEDPEHADALNALGYTLADRTERFEEAKGYIEKALALKPDDAAVLDSMGWVLHRLGNNEEALGYLRRALDKMQDGEIAAHLGQILWDTGRHEEAWQVWDAALVEHPGHEYLLRVIGRHRYTDSSSKPEQ